MKKLHKEAFPTKKSPRAKNYLLGSQAHGVVDIGSDINITIQEKN